MLINAQRTDQMRVAIVDGPELKDYQVQITDKNLCRGNIYRGIVANIQPSLGAAFIDIGEDRHGFLPVADVQPAAYHRKPPADVRRPRIDQVLERGKPILVQATKDGVGNKGAALSTNVALAGRYLVLTPFEAVSGISRKAEDDKSRKKIRQRLGKLSLPDGHGVIVRTNGLEQNQATLNRDLNALLRMWKRVNDESRKGQGPRLLYSDQDLIVQAFRDYLDSSIAEVVVDDDIVYEKARTYMRAFMPRSKTSLNRYNERLPLFTRYRIEQHIDRIYERKAPLPSGGSIVIDATEALTAIDVNSGRATQHGNHDESILNVNIEAAKEVARQLRLRDIGGLVVVDFIDMRTRKHQAKLEKMMRDAMKIDKARYSVGRISPNGLLEINRQRIKQALHQRTHRPCPSCHGVGTIPSPDFAAATLLGRIEARVAPGLIEKATVAVHPEIADALQNHYRSRLVALETELDLHIEVISATNFNRTEERIDYQQRETAVVPKPVAALSSSDLADEDRSTPQAKQDKGEVASEEAPKKPARKRRRRRKSAPKTEKTADALPAESTDTPAEVEEAAAPSEGTPGNETSNGKPPRPRRRRRGGRRSRKSPEKETPAGDAEPAASAESSASPSQGAGDGHDWNAGITGATEELPPKKAPETATEREPKPTRRSRPRRSGKTADLDAQPTHDDAWRSPNDREQPPPGPQARRSPLRRDRSTLRWQWWGGGSEDADQPTGGFPPVADSDDG